MSNETIVGALLSWEQQNLEERTWALEMRPIQVWFTQQPLTWASVSLGNIIANFPGCHRDKIKYVYKVWACKRCSIIRRFIVFVLKVNSQPWKYWIFSHTKHKKILWHVESLPKSSSPCFFILFILSRKVSLGNCYWPLTGVALWAMKKDNGSIDY